MTDVSALYGLRLHTPRLELRLGSRAELKTLAEVAKAGIHPPDEMPFAVPWTDASADPGFVAADLLAQAEHGSGDETVVLVTPSHELAAEVVRLVGEGRASVANRVSTRRALARNAAVLLVRDLAEGVQAVNVLAPEHVEVLARSAARLAREIVAGAVFVGPFSPVAVGDYGIGPNHVLPTGGSARFASPLSVRDFQRRQSVVTLSRKGLSRVAEDVVRVAMAEGFRGHAQSVLTRFEGI